MYKLELNSYRHIGSVNIEDLESILNKISKESEWIKDILIKGIKNYAYCFVYYSKEQNAFVLEPWGEKNA
jgi:hypothetical protein